MLQEFEQSIADRVRLAIPTTVARVRAFSETQQKGNGRTELIGSIIVGYNGSSFSNLQPPFAQQLSFVIISSLKNLRNHQPSLWVVDQIRDALMDFTPDGSCSTYTPNGLRPVSERFVELDDDGQLFVWEQTFSLTISATQWADCCSNPNSSYANDQIGYYNLANTALIEVEQRGWSWFNVETGEDLGISPVEALNSIFLVSWANNQPILINEPSTPLYFAQDGPQLLCQVPVTGEPVICSTGAAPVMPSTVGTWSLQRTSPQVVVGINP